jgi:hypothetical protein
VPRRNDRGFARPRLHDEQAAARRRAAPCTSFHVEVDGSLAREPFDLILAIRQIEAKALRELRHPSRSKQLKSFIES